jgi:NADH-quinone oxidoreductase subunit L
MEAPTSISALIHAATMVNAGVYLLARFQPAFAAVPGWSATLVLVGLTSALLGGLLALVETDLKRALAFSTTSQLGLMVLAVGLGALFAAQFHLLSHAVFKALLFLSAGAVIYTDGTRDLRLVVVLCTRKPNGRACDLVGVVALAGLPLANGFWSKELILAAASDSGLPWLGAGLLAATALTALYAARLAWLVFFGGPRSTLGAHDAPTAMRLALGPLAIATLLGWLLAGPLGRLLAVGAPPAGLHAPSTVGLVVEVLSSPVTALSLTAAACGLALWRWRHRLAWLMPFLRLPARALAAGLGFEWLNQQVVAGVRGLAGAALRTQTGQLGWNLAALAGALVVLLALLGWGA